MKKTRCGYLVETVEITLRSFSLLRNRERRRSTSFRISVFLTYEIFLERCSCIYYVRE